MFWSRKSGSALPGFGLSLSYTGMYLSLLVLIPLAALAIKSFGMSWALFWQTATDERVVASYKISFGLALLAAILNLPLGLLLAWVLSRYSFPGRKFIDAFIDLPFALPTAVAGLALSALYSENGWIGKLLLPLGIKVAFTPFGIFVAFLFVGLPFIVRTVQPVLMDLDRRKEEAAAILGASRFATFFTIVLPQLRVALLTGFSLAFARAVGEYGSVIFIAGNIPYVSEITPLLIISKLEQFDYQGATALAMVMLLLSFALLLLISTLQHRKPFTRTGAKV